MYFMLLNFRREIWTIKHQALKIMEFKYVTGDTLKMHSDTSRINTGEIHFQIILKCLWKVYVYFGSCYIKSTIYKRCFNTNYNLKKMKQSVGKVQSLWLCSRFILHSLFNLSSNWLLKGHFCVETLPLHL